MGVIDWAATGIVALLAALFVYITVVGAGR
jgi:hypothetical protein